MLRKKSHVLKGKYPILFGVSCLAGMQLPVVDEIQGHKTFIFFTFFFYNLLLMLSLFELTGGSKDSMEEEHTIFPSN